MPRLKHQPPWLQEQLCPGACYRPVAGTQPRRTHPRGGEERQKHQRAVAGRAYSLSRSVSTNCRWLGQKAAMPRLVAERKTKL